MNNNNEKKVTAQHNNINNSFNVLFAICRSHIISTENRNSKIQELLNDSKYKAIREQQGITFSHIMAACGVRTVLDGRDLLASVDEDNFGLRPVDYFYLVGILSTNNLQEIPFTPLTRIITTGKFTGIQFFLLFLTFRERYYPGTDLTHYIDAAKVCYTSTNNNKKFTTNASSVMTKEAEEKYKIELAKNGPPTKLWLDLNQTIPEGIAKEFNLNQLTCAVNLLMSNSSDFKVKLSKLEEFSELSTHDLDLNTGETSVADLLFQNLLPNNSWNFFVFVTNFFKRHNNAFITLNTSRIKALLANKELLLILLERSSDVKETFELDLSEPTAHMPSIAYQLFYDATVTKNPEVDNIKLYRKLCAATKTKQKLLLSQTGEVIAQNKITKANFKQATLFYHMLSNGCIAEINKILLTNVQDINFNEIIRMGKEEIPLLNFFIADQVMLYHLKMFLKFNMVLHAKRNLPYILDEVINTKLTAKPIYGMTLAGILIQNKEWETLKDLVKAGTTIDLTAIYDKKKKVTIKTFLENDSEGRDFLEFIETITNKNESRDFLEFIEAMSTKDRVQVQAVAASPSEVTTDETTVTPTQSSIQSVDEQSANEQTQPGNLTPSNQDGEVKQDNTTVVSDSVSIPAEPAEETKKKKKKKHKKKPLPLLEANPAARQKDDVNINKNESENITAKQEDTQKQIDNSQGETKTHVVLEMSDMLKYEWEQAFHAAFALLLNLKFEWTDNECKIILADITEWWICNVSENKEKTYHPFILTNQNLQTIISIIDKTCKEKGLGEFITDPNNNNLTSLNFKIDHCDIKPSPLIHLQEQIFNYITEHCTPILFKEEAKDESKEDNENKKPAVTFKPIAQMEAVEFFEFITQGNFSKNTFQKMIKKSDSLIVEFNSKAFPSLATSLGPINSKEYFKSLDKILNDKDLKPVSSILLIKHGMIKLIIQTKSIDTVINKLQKRFSAELEKLKPKAPLSRFTLNANAPVYTPISKTKPAAEIMDNNNASNDNADELAEQTDYYPHTNFMPSGQHSFFSTWNTMLYLDMDNTNEDRQYENVENVEDHNEQREMDERSIDDAQSKHLLGADLLNCINHNKR